MAVAVIALIVSFGGSAIADGVAEIARTVNGKSIKKRSIPASKLKKNTLTGAEVKESKLAKVPSAKKADTATRADTAKRADTAGSANTAGIATSATVATNALTAGSVGGVGPETFTVGRSNKGSCDPTDATKVACASTAFTLPRAGRVFVVATTMWHSNSAAATRGACNVSVDGTDASGDVFPGQFQNNTDPTHEQPAGVTLVTDVLSPASHTFALTCNQLQNDIQFNAAFISAVMIGSA